MRAVLASALAARPFHRIAIVNRGEPAMRLIHAVRELTRAGPSLTTIALYTDVDAGARFVHEADEAVRIGPPVYVNPLTGQRGSGYLDHESLQRALVQARADAAWVGWGFVAEQPEFAELCERLGVVFVGPSARAMRRLGDKIESKRLAEALQVPLAPWSGPVHDLPEALRQAARIGYPLLVKASAGGGGRGVRVVDEPQELGLALESARAEARNAFGDATLFMERLVPQARHVEVQVACDASGGVWTLGVRDCSLQRRHQKVIEESASTVLGPDRERELMAAATRLCRAVDYVGLATVEFLLDTEDGSLSFMEVNARLQVEHPVTEAVTGVDLVKLQLELAAGRRLQGDAPPAAGHAVEARLCAEDPESGFAPAPGVIEQLRLPGGPGVRVDTGVAEGDAIPAEFDSMIAKVVAWGRDRQEALDRLTRALRETTVVVREGTTNRSFLLRVLARAEVAGGTFDVGWLERVGVETEPTDPRRARIALLAAAVEVAAEELRIEQARFYASAAGGRPEAGGAAGRSIDLTHDDQAYRFKVYALGPSEYRVSGEGGCAELQVERLGRFERHLVYGGRRHSVVVVPRGGAYLVEVDGGPLHVRSGDAGTVRAPSPGIVSAVLVQPGDQVAAGTAVAVLEAMKMESAVFTPISGTVSRVMVGANVQVGAGTPLVHLDPSYGPQRRSARVRLDESDACDEFDGDHYLADLLLLRRLVLGFDTEAEDVNRAVAAHARLASGGPADEAARALEDEVLTIFADVCSLAQVRPPGGEDWGEQVHSARDHFFEYLRAPDARGVGLPADFVSQLRSALRHYGVDGLERTPALEQGLFRIFKAQVRVEQQLPAVMAILQRRVEQAGGDLPPLAGGGAPRAEGAVEDAGLRSLLDRIVAATQRRFPAVTDLAREARYRYFHQPQFERGRKAVYSEMERHLVHLGANPAAGDRAERIGSLVDCPQPLEHLLTERACLASPDQRRLMLEVLVRRYYRIRDLEGLGTFRVEGRTWAAARFREAGRPARVLSAFEEYGALEGLITQLAAVAAAQPTPDEVVADLHLWRSGPPADASELEPAVQAALRAADLPRSVVRVDVGVSGRGRGAGTAADHHFSYRRSGTGFEEDRACRGLHPMLAERLDLWRLGNFSIERLPSVEDVYLFHGVARENPADERLFAIAEVRDATPLHDESGRVVGLPHLERMFLEALAAIRRVQAHRPPGRRLQWNRVMLYVWPALEVRGDEMHAIVDRLAPATEDLGMEKTVVRARVADPETGEVHESVIHLTNLMGGGVMLMRYATAADRPIQPLSEYRQKVVQMRRRGLVYPYEITSLLAPPPDPDSTFPPGDFEEHDLDGQGRLVPVQRPPGRNAANLVVGVIRNVTWKHPAGMARVIVLGDPSRDLGAVAEPECRRIIAALDLAERLGVPVEWFALSSGARISMDSGTENMDWIAAVLRRLIEFTQAGGEVNVVVNGINVGAQPYWNAEATMLMHTRGILVMTPDGAMVLTGKQALDYSGGVSADDNFGIGGYQRIMGPNGQAQYFAPDLPAACRLLLRHYEHTYRAPGERFPRPATTSDPRDRDVRTHPHPAHLGGLASVGDVFSDERNPERKHAFDIRTVMSAVVDQDLEPLERWLGMRGAETAVTWDAHLGGYPVCLVGIESRPLPRQGPLPADGPRQWTSGTLFPLSSKKVARAINAASDNRPVVVLANLSGFDGSPESMRELQLEFGAEIGRAVVNFKGPMVFCVVSRYHGGAFVVFSGRLNEGLEVAAVEGSHASVIGGAPAAAVVFARDVEHRARSDGRVQALEQQLATAPAGEKPLLRNQLTALLGEVRTEKLGGVAREFDSVHSVGRAAQVGSVHRIIPAERLRPYLIEAVERGMRRELERRTRMGA